MGEHLRGAPTGDALEVAFVAAGGQPLVGEAVAEHMRVEVADAGLAGAASEHLDDPRIGERALAAEPPCSRSALLMSRPLAPVTVERFSGLVTVGNGAELSILCL